MLQLRGVSATGQMKVLANLGNDGPVHRLASERHSANQSVVTDHVDRSRNSARVLVNQRNGLAAEYLRGLSPGLANPARNVGAGLGQVEGLELASQRHALLQLPKVRLFEPCCQLRLSGQDQRQQ